MTLCHPLQVEYQCDGFLEKNRDTVYEEQINILKASKVRIGHFWIKRCALKEKKHFILIFKVFKFMNEI